MREQPALLRRVAVFDTPDINRKGMLCIKARVGTQNMQQVSQEEQSRYQQHQGKRHLTDDQSIAQCEAPVGKLALLLLRSEERRVGKECIARWSGGQWRISEGLE